MLAPAEAAELLEGVHDVQAADLIEDLSPNQAAAIVDHLQSDRQADVLAELDRTDADAILEHMDPGEARDVRQLLSYPPDTVGGIMITELLRYADDCRVADVVRDLRLNGYAYSDYDIQYAYVTSPAGALVGVLRLRDLLFARDDQPVADVMVRHPLRISLGASLEEMKQFFEAHAFVGAPVVDDRDRLVGVVRRRAVGEAIDEQASQTFLKFAGIGGREELRTMPLRTRSSRRLSWLSVNILLNVVAASVIALYQETLARAIILAVFLPIISDMSGCSGNQAVAVSIRELTLGTVRPEELRHVFLKELALGAVTATVLGLLLGTVAVLWEGNPYLGLVVGGALALNTLIAVSLGGLLPLILSRLRFDPALAAGPILTTITDMCGFLILLSMATALLSKLATP
jgi:magnesium transporter